MNPNISVKAIGIWLEPLRPLLDPGNRLDWPRLTALAETLDELIAIHPIVPGPYGYERSDQLRAIRIELARNGLLDTTQQPALFAVLAQFMCGYRDIDLRDSTGLSHGVLIARHASPAARRQWVPRLLDGELAGIAVTEPHGGSNPAATTTAAVTAKDGSWRVTGRKTWISRLTEAAVFVVFFRAPDGHLAAAAVDATEPGLRRQPITPAGLAGWAWGILDLDQVPICPDDVLRGEGMALLRNHFARYRPLITATALGGAAAMFDAVTAALTDRQTTGGVARLRDTALVTVGRAHAQLVTGLLGAVAAAQLAESGHPHAERWSAVMKAHGIDLADRATTDLMPLVGATGFRADGQLVKIRRDLGALLYADGVHDSLYRAAGKQHTAPTAPSPHPVSGLLPVSA
ncbi:acyl-CoA dehydrogenase family protein [Nocardia carnea]|uniref:acyl-CoA dehydrogenase family protein n=1 Tax=Nocardia carnea TaxID=37328 RepID=UPI002457F14D|nr:acyl-CoA dehydrogenase family protein [Nocardia carnea]